jgi:hypothetical protein
LFVASQNVYLFYFYDGDGKTDIAIYRDGGWFILNSTNGFAALGFGTATDKPVPNSFVP